LYQKTKYPDPEKNILKWKSRGKTEPAPFVIYADFESCLTPVEIDDDLTGHTHVVDQHVPSGFCAYTVSRYNEIDDEPFLYLSIIDCRPTNGEGHKKMPYGRH
jgi:hypothetical protein